MRIGFDAKRAFFNKSGLGNYSRNTISMLADIYPSEEYFLFSPNVPEILPKFSDNTTIVSPNISSKQKAAFWRSITASSAISQNKIDIYHGLSNEIPLNLHKKKIRSIVTIHDLIFLRYPELFRPIDVNIYTYKFKHACKKADRIIAVSKQTKEDIIKYFKISSAKIHVIYQDCNNIFHTKCSSKQITDVTKKYVLPDKYLLTVGTVEKRKNAMLILKAMALYDIDIPILIIGKPTPYINSLIAYAKQQGLKEKLVMRFNVESEDLPAIYQNASVFIYPSVFEGFGIPVLEALNSGVPVITSNASSLPEVAGSAGLLIDPGSHDHLAKTLYNLLNDKELQNTLIDAGYTQAKKFRGDVLAPKIMQIYQYIA